MTAVPAGANVTPAPTNVTVTAGDVEATISWTLGTSVACPLTHQWVRVTNATTSEAVAESEDLGNTTTSWFVDELTAGTTYDVYIWGHQGGSCGYSAAGRAKFTTAASTSGSDPTAPSGNKRRKPRNVGSLAVTDSGTTATVTWNAPASGNGKRCSPLTEYNWRLRNMTTKTSTYLVNNIGHQTVQSSTTANLTGLTAGNKYRITVYVNSRCGWSTGRSRTWTQ
ncbi:fibronectin type III domain-containing protein [Candidatus Poriferisodalis sp.]|uniref:fibronectin type III domain-containing protein n=1 Tax=Candidatus Poriferisodalis sp. TaxID=3101277 RepID=UPI003B0156A9